MSVDQARKILKAAPPGSVYHDMARRVLAALEQKR
jgi:hypothetical protein